MIKYKDFIDSFAKPLRFPDELTVGLLELATGKNSFQRPVQSFSKGLYHIRLGQR